MAYERRGRGAAPMEQRVLPNFRNAPSAISPRQRTARSSQPAGFEWAMQRVMQAFTPAPGATPVADPGSMMAAPSLGGFSALGGMDLGQETDPFQIEQRSELADLDQKVDSDVPTPREDPLDMRRADVANAQERSTELADTMAATDKLLENSPTPEAMVEIMKIREQVALELQQLEKDILNTRTQLQVQDEIFEFELAAKGLDLDVASLTEAVTTEGGVGQQTLDAINEITGNSAMTPEEQGMALDAVVNRAKFSDELVRTMNDMVANQQTLEELESRPDADLLENPEDFFFPMFPNVLNPDPLERWDANFLDTMSEQLPDVNVETKEQWDMIDNVNGMINTLGVDHLNTQNLIKMLADSLGVEYNPLRTALMESNDRANQSEQALELASTSNNITPGSEAMVYALYEAGLNAETPMPEEFIMLLANSRDIHTIIDVMSGGRSGQHSKNGTTAGVGGLTEEMYEYLMGEPWSEDKGMIWELEALIQYIFGGFGGDPMAAVHYYRQTGDWGGVYSSTGPSEVPSNGE